VTIVALEGGVLYEVQEDSEMLLLILLVVLILAVMPAWPYSSGWGYYPSGGLGTVLVVLVVLMLLGYIRI